MGDPLCLDDLEVLECGLTLTLPPALSPYSLVELTDLVQLRYYTEYQWLLDFSCYSLFTYILSELYISLLPAKAATEVCDDLHLPHAFSPMMFLQVNLSLVWVVLVLIFTYKLLLSLNGLYFEVENSHC